MTQKAKKIAKAVALILVLLLVAVGNLVLLITIGWVGFTFYSLGLGFLTARDYVQTKRPFDRKKEVMDLYDDWFIWIYDDLIMWNLGGMIGAGLSGEVFMPLLVKYMEWPEIAEVSLGNTGILICTVLGASFLNRLINGKVKK